MDDRRHRSAFGQGSENDDQELVSARARRRQMLAAQTARRDAIAETRISGACRLIRPHRALASYHQRWTIETLFANLKTKGFNLEDTHITDPEKLSTLLALTVTLCVETGVAEARLRPIHIKKHGRRAWSLFALGVGVLRKIIVSAKPAQIIPLLQQLLSSKLPVNTIEIHRGLNGSRARWRRGHSLK
jgi:hypothetical protein